MNMGDRWDGSGANVQTCTCAQMFVRMHTSAWTNVKLFDPSDRFRIEAEWGQRSRSAGFARDRKEPSAFTTCSDTLKNYDFFFFLPSKSSSEWSGERLWWSESLFLPVRNPFKFWLWLQSREGLGSAFAGGHWMRIHWNWKIILFFYIQDRLKRKVLTS